MSNITRYGYLGVPLFFMISGFVICASAQNRTPIAFAVSRFVRLYPAYWFAVTLTALILALYESPVSWVQYIANMTMLNDYAEIPNISQIYWTLQAELKFYSCVFLLLVFGVFDKYRIWLGVWTGTTVTYLFFKQPYFMGWFISPEYSSFFIAGVVFYLLWQRGMDWYYLVILVVSIAVSSFKAYHQVGGFMNQPESEAQMISVFLVWGFYLLFALLAAGLLNMKRNQVVLILGGMTYPLYLLHSKIGGALINAYQTIYPRPILIVFVIMTMLYLSYLVHIHIEKRFSTPLKSFLLRFNGRFND